MVRNKISDLNDHLFAQLERLQDEDLSADQIKSECRRAKAIVDVSDQIVGSKRLAIDAARLFAQHGETVLPYLPQVGQQPTKLKVVNGDGPDEDA